MKSKMNGGAVDKLGSFREIESLMKKIPTADVWAVLKTKTIQVHGCQELKFAKPPVPLFLNSEGKGISEKEIRAIFLSHNGSVIVWAWEPGAVMLKTVKK